MNYATNFAVVENGIVTNVAWGMLYNMAADFPNAVQCDDRPVAIGDSYAGGVFTRDGEPVLTETERLAAEVAEYDAALTEIETALGVSV